MSNQAYSEASHGQLLTVARSHEALHLTVIAKLLAGTRFGFFSLTSVSLSLSLSNFTLSFFIIITVGSRSDLASHVWVLTSHARERHVVLKWAGKLSWPMREAELAK